MRFWVDAWDPAYAAGGEAGEGGGPAQQSSAELDLGVEVPPERWAPIPAPADLRAPDTVLLVDGVRRIDARVWTAEPDGTSFPGLAASFAAGAVRCCRRTGKAELAELAVERGLFTASPTAGPVASGALRWPVYTVTDGDISILQQAVQGPLNDLEVRVATAARSAREDLEDLLVVDGPLRGRAHLPRSIGYVKTHRRQYLPPELTGVVMALAPGQRSPVFTLGTSWHRYTWYLRLPGGSGAPWSAVVRAECPIDLTVQAALRQADLSAVTLPRFASTAYKDPRAPQNLIPIAGLEQRLRARLGDPRLLHRALSRAGAGGSGAGASASR